MTSPVSDPLRRLRESSLVTSYTSAAVLDPRWLVGPRPHGGYLLALMAEAVTAATQRRHPIAASVLFLEAPAIGDVEITVDVMRVGRSLTHARSSLCQNGVCCAEALVVAGDLDGGTSPRWAADDPPHLPPFASCPRAPAGARPSVIELWQTLEVRLDPATAGWTRREPSGEAESRGWIDFGDERLPPCSGLLIALDTLPAVTLELGSRGWVPTIELSAYLRATPAPGPLRARQRGRLIHDGFVDETCEIWDSRGLLVAHSTQLARVRFQSP